MRNTTPMLAGATIVAVLAAGVLGTAAVLAQEKPEAPAAPAPAPAPDYGALVKDLGSEDFAVRTKAYESLEAAGTAARKALDEAAGSEDAQVKWSVRRLLRRLDGGEAAPRGVLRFGEVQPPRPAPRPQALDDIERRFQEMEKRFADLRGALRIEPGIVGERHVIVDGDGERVEARVAEDGKVTVKVGTKGADGKLTEESFEAKDMATLEKEHPEVAAKIKGLMGNKDMGSLGGWPTWSVQGNDLLDSLNPRAAEKPVLGVTLSAVPDVLRTQLSVPENEGVVVEGVLEGTPAGKMGLRRHDVILSVNGTPVSEARSVRAAVMAVKEGGELKVRILRGGKTEEIAGTR